MATAPAENNKKRVLFVVEAMGGGVFTYIVDLANVLVDTYDMYIAYSVRRQTPEDFQDYFDPHTSYSSAKLDHPYTIYMGDNAVTSYQEVA